MAPLTLYFNVPGPGSHRDCCSEYYPSDQTTDGYWSFNQTCMVKTEIGPQHGARTSFRANFNMTKTLY